MTTYATFKLAMAKTGPNDASHAVWALGQFTGVIFFSLCIFDSN